MKTSPPAVVNDAFLCQSGVGDALAGDLIMRPARIFSLLLCLVAVGLRAQQSDSGQTAVRSTGALFAGAAATAWIARRMWDLPNPADALVMALAGQAASTATGLTL